jgi:hypothetical protein
MRRTRACIAAISLVAAIGLVGAACAPPAPGGGGPAPVDWSFKGTQITNVDSQDEVRVLGACVAIPNCNDEPYLMTVAFRVAIGQPGSAQTWVVKGSSLSNVEEGETRTLTGGQQGTVNFPGIVPLDALDALNPSNKMEIVGTYTWAAEEDLIDSLSTGANGVADLFEDALNDLLASSVLPEDPEDLINLVLDLLFNNVGSAFDIFLSNFPCLGLCDDVLGGRVYVGLGATGTLGATIDGLLGGFSVPSITLLGDNLVPPNVQGGGIFTLSGAKSFNSQSFIGADGHHSYNFLVGPA